MATLDQSYHIPSVARYKQLMQYRKAMIDSSKDLARIDLDIAKAFDPESAKEIDKRLDRVKELSAIRKQMVAMDLKMVNSRATVSRILSPEGYKMYDDDIARWKELKEIREQMADLRIDTTVIDNRITNVFDAQAETHLDSPYLATPTQSPSTCLPLRKRAASVELEPAPEVKRRASAQNDSNVAVPQAKKPEAWEAGKESNWAVSAQIICMAGSLYHSGTGELGFLQPDPNTQTFQVYQSRLDHSHLYASLTRSHPALQFSPASIRRVIKAQGSPKARLVLCDSMGGDENIDITFFEHLGVVKLVSKLKEVGDICVEQIDSKRINELFANNRLRKKKVLI